MAADRNANSDAVVAAFFELEFEAECEVAVFLLGEEILSAGFADQVSIFREVPLGIARPASQVFAVEQFTPLSGLIEEAQR
jgi:hypothetical protein